MTAYCRTPSMLTMCGQAELMSTRTMAVPMARPATRIAIGCASCVNLNSSRPWTTRKRGKTTGAA